MQQAHEPQTHQRPGWQIGAYLVEVFTRPFRPAPIDITKQSLVARNQERRRLITRLFSLFTGIVVLLVAFPVSFVQTHSFTTSAILLLIAGLGLGESS